LTYTEYRTNWQREFDSLPIFFAFSDSQFEACLKERGLTLNDLDKICKVAGGFALKTDIPVIREFVEKPDPLADLMNDPTFAEDAFYYEMCNHEYGINMQGAWDVCSCFGDCKYVDGKTGPMYLAEMGYGPDVCDAYRRAKVRYFKDAEEHEWF